MWDVREGELTWSEGWSCCLWESSKVVAWLGRSQSLHQLFTVQCNELATWRQSDLDNTCSRIWLPTEQTCQENKHTIVSPSQIEWKGVRVNQACLKTACTWCVPSFGIPHDDMKQYNFASSTSRLALTAKLEHNYMLIAARILHNCSLNLIHQVKLDCITVEYRTSKCWILKLVHHWGIPALFVRMAGIFLWRGSLQMLEHSSLRLQRPDWMPMLSCLCYRCQRGFDPQFLHGTILWLSVVSGTHHIVVIRIRFSTSGWGDKLCPNLCSKA